MDTRTQRRAMSFDRSLQDGLAFLETQQLPSGQFRMDVLRRDRIDPTTGLPVVFQESSVFCTAHVGDSLRWSDDPRATRMIERAAAFLDGERLRGDVWRYYCRNAAYARYVPPDVDDTSCVAGFLRSQGRSIQGSIEALLGNRSREGLFHTWFTPRMTRGTARWWMAVLSDVTPRRLLVFWRPGAKIKGGATRNDVDAVVNANVVAFLGDRIECRPSVEWLLGIAESGEEEHRDKWYQNSFAFYYSISRCHAAGLTVFERAVGPMLRRFAESTSENGRIGANVLDTALALCALSAFRSEDEYPASLDYLRREQMPDGGWGAFHFYHDGRKAPNVSFMSRAVTTAFCIQALARWSRPAPG